MNKLFVAALLGLSLMTGTAAVAATYNAGQYYSSLPQYPADGGR